MIQQETRTVGIETQGCKLNQADSQLLAQRFAEAGYTLVSPDSIADVYVLNSCTVTHIADRKARQAIQALRRRNPKALLLMTGCYAQRAPAEVARVAGINLVVGNSDKERLVQQVAELQERPPVAFTVGDEASWRTIVGRTRAMVKIQEGCDQVCAYCIVPRVRGRERSVPLLTLLDQIGTLVKAGCQEVVLTGTQLGSYGFDLARGSLSELVGRVLEEMPIARLRVSSLQPREVGEELLANWADPRLCPHFHLPLQSGSDAVLKRMRRRYSAKEYLEAVELIRRRVSSAAITADVIVGFPGETEVEFQETMALCAAVGFAALHIFPYSVRPGTSAAHFSNQVDVPTKRRRMEALLALAEEQTRLFQQGQVGTTHRVLWENRRRVGDVEVWRGLTEHYVRVCYAGREELANTISQVRLEQYDGDVLWAVPIAEPGD